MRVEGGVINDIFVGVLDRCEARRREDLEENEAEEVGASGKEAEE